jgi:hypothetical protein
MQLPYMFHPHVTGIMYYSYTVKTKCSGRCTCSAARCTLQRRYHNFYTSQRTVRDAFSTFCNFHFLLLLPSACYPSCASISLSSLHIFSHCIRDRSASISSKDH